MVVDRPGILRGQPLNRRQVLLEGMHLLQNVLAHAAQGLLEDFAQFLTLRLVLDLSRVCNRQVAWILLVVQADLFVFARLFEAAEDVDIFVEFVELLQYQLQLALVDDCTAEVRPLRLCVAHDRDDDVQHNDQQHESRDDIDDIEDVRRPSASIPGLVGEEGLMRRVAQQHLEHVHEGEYGVVIGDFIVRILLRIFEMDLLPKIVSSYDHLPFLTFLRCQINAVVHDSLPDIVLVCFVYV